MAPRPTASTAQILGNNESFEPYTQHLYARRVLSTEFVQVNRHLLRDLSALGLLPLRVECDKGTVPTGCLAVIPDPPGWPGPSGPKT